MQHFQHQKVSR